MAYPEWVEKERRSGTNITCIRGKYYLYEVKSVWDKEKGRARKVTGKYLGRITEEGLIPPRRENKKAQDFKVSTKEYGASKVLLEFGKDIFEVLKDRFPNDAERLFVLAILRVIEKCPFKRASFLYDKSYLSEYFGKLSLSSASLSNFLKEFGMKRKQIVGFMKEFIGDSDYVLFDGTNIISQSENAGINRVGYNSHGDYDPQINLMYAFSSDEQSPGYYRIVPGNIRDVTAFKNAIKESGIKNAVIIADKGFGSEANFNQLKEAQCQYIVPLKRNSSNINREIIKSGDKAKFGGYFMYNGRVVWHYSYMKNQERFIVYLDETLKAKEERDYLSRLKENIEDYSHEDFIERQYKFGTITFQTNLSDENSPEKIYKLYKTRGEIEMTFDFLKNLLGQDNTYLQNKYSMEAWSFINHLSLMLVYRIYNALNKSEILSKYSIQDFISHLKYIHYLKIDDSWVVSEISQKTQKLLDKLKLHIT